MPRKSKNSTHVPKSPKPRILNVKVTEEDYMRVTEIGDKLGVTVSAMLRIILNNQLSKVDKSGDPSYFLHSK